MGSVSMLRMSHRSSMADNDDRNGARFSSWGGVGATPALYHTNQVNSYGRGDYFADDNMKRGRRRKGPGNVSAQRPSLLFVANSVVEAQKPLNFFRILVEGAIAGATAGVVVETALYPIDTIKTRLQEVVTLDRAGQKKSFILLKVTANPPFKGKIESKQRSLLTLHTKTSTPSTAGLCQQSNLVHISNKEKRTLLVH